ncbi:MAG: acyl-CoA dehydrogenase family protein, partial [Planctomycetota bacterium]
MIRFTDEHHGIREMVADFSDNELATRAAALDEEAAFPAESLKMLAGLGLLGIAIPEELGGAGGDFLTAVLALEELGRGCGSSALVLNAHAVQATLAILEDGTDEQRQRWLPRIASGELLATFAIAESDAETDAGAIASTAVRQGDGWVINGLKKLVVAGSEAGLYVVVARTDSEERGTAGLSLFVVEGGARATGVTSTPEAEMLGMRGSATAEVAFDECRLDGDALLGTREGNFSSIARILEGGRVGVAAIAAGVGRGALASALAYASQRRAFGQTIDRFEAIREMLAVSATAIEGARFLTWSAAARHDRGERITREASTAKYA